MKERVAKGFTFLKMDLGIPLIRRTPGMLTLPKNYDWKAYNQQEHPFTQIQITDKGLDALAHFVARMREVIGPDIPRSVIFRSDGLEFRLTICVASAMSSSTEAEAKPKANPA